MFNAPFFVNRLTSEARIEARYANASKQGSFENLALTGVYPSRLIVPSVLYSCSPKETSAYTHVLPVGSRTIYPGPSSNTSRVEKKKG